MREGDTEGCQGGDRDGEGTVSSVGAGQQEGGRKREKQGVSAGDARGPWRPRAQGGKRTPQGNQTARQQGEKGRNKPQEEEEEEKEGNRRRKKRRRREEKGEGRRGRGGGIGGGSREGGEKSDVEGLALESGAGLSNVAKCRWRKSEWTLLALADGSKLCCYEGSQPHNISL